MDGPLVAGIALGPEGTRKAVQTNVSLPALLKCYCFVLLFLLVHPAQLGDFLLHSYSVKQVSRSFGRQCDSGTLSEEFCTVWSFSYWVACDSAGVAVNCKLTSGENGDIRDL